MNKGAFDRREAASYLSISTRTLDHLATQGELPRLKLGRKTLFRRLDLDRYLERLAGEEQMSEETEPPCRDHV